MSRSLGACAALWLLVSCVANAHAVPAPTVVGPVTGGNGAPFVASTFVSLTPFGYVEEEFFVSGTADGYTSTAPLASDGLWAAEPDTSAAYTTRIVVRRPVARSRFNGTVIVEWLNVTAGLDAAPDWTFAHTFLLREGFAWVGVSAQQAGIESSGGVLGVDLSLKAIDPVRYAPLVHPGDSFSYDMFSQVAEAVRRPAGLAPLGNLDVKRVIAVGESQSAFRLVTYINAVHPLAEVYDGFLVHSRAAGAAALSQAPQPAVNAPSPTFIRGDVDVPVVTLQTETDLITLGSIAARQPDGPHFRLWEVAGTAHVDVYQLDVGPYDAGRAAADTTHVPPVTSIYGGLISCDTPINAGPQHYVVSAALSQLDRWVRFGTPAAIAPRLQVSAGPPAALVLDEHGNALGGIRTPQVDVPVATLSGLGQTGTALCVLFGTTTPFDAATLATLYPTHQRYVRAVRKAAKAAVGAGFVLRKDSRAIIRAAAASDVGA